MKKTVSMFLAGILMLALCACGETPPPTTDISPSGSVTAIELTVGEEKSIDAGSGDWTSSSVAVRIREKDGKLIMRGVSEGVSKVTDGVTVYLVSVVVKPADMTVENAYIEIDASKSAQAEIVVTGREPSEFTYETGDDAIATVDGKGNVRARGNGVTFVTVTDKKSRVTKRVSVAVSGMSPLLRVSYLNTGVLPVRGHVQGVCADRYGETFYYSMTDALVAQSADGTILGAVTGIDGHLGDVAYNEKDGYVYGSLTFGEEKSYIARFDPQKITRFGMSPDEACSVIYIGTPIEDMRSQGGYGSQGQKLSEEWMPLGGKFGLSGTIDACTFGPKFGDDDGNEYLTVALSVPAYNTEITLSSGVTKRPADRYDNDYLVLVQFDVSDWDQYAVPYSRHETASGPTVFDHTVFFRYLYHDYAIQNLCYDGYTNTYIATAYDAPDKDVSPFNFYFIDPTVVEEKPLIGNGNERGLCVGSKYGLKHGSEAVRGYDFYCGLGFVSTHDGGYYRCEYTYQDYTNNRSNARLQQYIFNLTEEDAETATIPFAKV